MQRFFIMTIDLARPILVFKYSTSLEKYPPTSSTRKAREKGEELSIPEFLVGEKDFWPEN